MKSLRGSGLAVMRHDAGILDGDFVRGDAHAVLRLVAAWIVLPGAVDDVRLGQVDGILRDRHDRQAIVGRVMSS